MDASDSGCRLKLDAECRPNQLNKILMNLTTCFPSCASLDWDGLVKMANWLEEENYAEATSYSDYMYRVYLRLLRLEQRFRTTPVFHGMQSQVHNQGQQLLSQDVQNTNFPPALPFMTSLTQTLVPNAGGLNMQSGITQNIVGSSVSQGLPSNNFSNTQWQMSEWDQLQHQQHLLQLRLMKQDLLQPTQMSNAFGLSTNLLPEITAQYLFQQQQEQQLMKQNPLQPTQMLNVVGRSTNTESEIAHAEDLFQQQRKQQHQRQLMNPQLVSSSMNSNAQAGENADDWREEIYHKMTAMKQSFLPYLKQIYQRTFKKCEQLKGNVSVSNVPECERQKLLDLLNLLEGHMRILNVSKDAIVPSMKGRLDNYEKQVIDLIKSNMLREPVSAQQQIQQPGGHQQQQQHEEVENQPDATHETIDVIMITDLD